MSVPRTRGASGMKPKEKSAFDAQAFFESIGAWRRVAECRRKQIIFSQGEAAEAGAKGQIRLTIRFLRASRIRKDPMQLELLYGFWGTKAAGSFRCVRVAVFGQLRFADSVMRLRGIV